MKRLSQLAATITLLFAATVLAKAEPIDPVFHLDDPDTGLPITSLGFSFSSNGNGGGFLQFMNESGFDWYGLTAQAIQPTGSIFSCSGGPFFSDCLISSIDQENGLSLFSLNFSSRLKLSGISQGEYFTVNLNNFVNEVLPIDPNGIGGWGPNTAINVQVNDYLQSTTATPEPVTWALILAGVLVIGSVRYTWKLRSSN